MAHTHANISDHCAEEFYTFKPFRLFETNLTYDIDETGHLGLSLGYQCGKDEDTGTPLNLLQIGLTGKI